MEPPRFESGDEPKFPEGASGERHLDLLLLIGEDGSVREVSVEEPVGDAFEAEALLAARKFKFKPALVDGKPRAVRIRFPIHFHASHAEAEREPLSEGTEVGTVSVQEPPKRGEAEDHHLEVTVHGERPLRGDSRGASHFHLHREVLEAAPRAEGADALLSVPGLILSRPEGLAVSHEMILRGFDAGHGQDIEVVVGGLPINLPSHIFGQGYTDLGFLIGSVIDEVRASEGVSDPKQGDFAVAGTIDVGLGVDTKLRGLNLRSSYGSFDTFREQAVWAPKEASRESFGAAQITSTAGFGENRAGQSGSAIFQHRFGEGRLTYRAIGFATGAQSSIAGFIRRTDVDRGIVCYYCSYDTPSTNAQNAQNQRIMAGVFADYRGYRHASGTVGLWVSHDRFRLQQNYTGFLETSRTLAGVSGRGDLVEQRNVTNSVGLVGRYRTEAFEPHELLHGTVEIGSDARLDGIEQAQNLLDASVRNQTWDRRIDASISALSLGLFGDLDFQIGSRLVVRAGGRAQLSNYEIDDRLGNFAPLTRPQDQYIVGYRRASSGLVFGPRASAEYRVGNGVTLLAAYGQGFRSPQALTLEDGERSPFSIVNSGDGGVRVSLGEPLSFTASGFYTHLSSDVVFDASDGTLAKVGASSRLGAAFSLLARVNEWLLTSFSVTYVRATLLEPPPATAEEPNPPFVPGQPLPYVSPLVARVDMSVERPLVTDFYGESLRYRLSTGLTYRHARPLPYEQTGATVGLVDAGLGLLWSRASLTVEGFNLLDLAYPATELSYVSDFSQNDPPSRVPVRHLSAGAPRAFLLTLGVTL